MPKKLTKSQKKSRKIDQQKREAAAVRKEIKKEMEELLEEMESQFFENFRKLLGDERKESLEKYRLSEAKRKAGEPEAVRRAKKVIEAEKVPLNFSQSSFQNKPPPEPEPPKYRIIVREKTPRAPIPKPKKQKIPKSLRKFFGSDPAVIFNS